MVEPQKERNPCSSAVSSSLKRTRSQSRSFVFNLNLQDSPQSQPPLYCQHPTTPSASQTPKRPPNSPILRSIITNVVKRLANFKPIPFRAPSSQTSPNERVPSSTTKMEPSDVASTLTGIKLPLMPTPSSPLSDLSEFSRSPSPPSLSYMDYPSSNESSILSSPPSTMEASPTPESSQISCTNSDERPTKRRRTSGESKIRSTQLLDLTSDAISSTQNEQLDKLMKLLRNKRKIVVVAGAGISVSAGIPDFRSSKGLFRTLKKQHNLKSSGKDLFDASVYKDADSTSSFHQMVRELSTMSKVAEPTAFHHMLSKLAQEDRLLRLYTQNVDGLETSMDPLQTTVPLNRKGPWPKTIQLHGGLQKMVCSKCNEMSDLEAELFDGPVPPLCDICIAADNARTEHAGKRSHGIGRLRPRMVLYNEHNPDDEAIGAVVKADLRTRPDALIVVGTTLKIPGVKRIVKEMGAIIRGRRDGLNVWINMDDPPVSKDYEWDIVVRGPCDRVAREADARIWDDRRQSVSEEEAEASSANHTVEVQVINTPSRTVAEQSLPTPGTSRPSSNPPPALSQSKIKAPDFQKKKPGPKPGFKRATKPKAPGQSVARKGKRPVVVVKNSTIAFSSSKATVSIKKRKSVDNDRPLSPTDKENSTPPAVDIKEESKSQQPAPLSPISEARSVSPGGSEAQRSPKHSIGFIMN